MPSKSAKPKLIVILGPTAVGKTGLSIALAERIGGEIVSADSRLFYRGMDIGTAKPSLEERGRVRHHLIDVADPDETWSLAVFQREANRAIQGILKRENVPMMVGGTGQYIRAVTEGWHIPEQAPDNALREVLEDLAEEIGAGELHKRLAVIDADAAAKIDARNVRRVVRAIEVTLLTGERFSSQRRQTDPAYEVLQIGLRRPREDLYARIDERIERMLADGFLEEVNELLSQYPPDLPSFSAIGYQQLIAHIQGELSLEEALAEMKRLTRQFVRRQANWFKPDDPAIQWARIGEKALDTAEQLALDFLEK